MRAVTDVDGNELRLNDAVTYVHTLPNGEGSGRVYWVEGLDPKRQLVWVRRLGWMGAGMMRKASGRKYDGIPPVDLTRDYGGLCAEARKYGHGHDSLGDVARAVLSSARCGSDEVTVVVGGLAKAVREACESLGYDALVTGDGEVTVSWR